MQITKTTIPYISFFFSFIQHSPTINVYQNRYFILEYIIQKEIGVIQVSYL